MEINYEEYTLKELYQVKESVNREKYPENYKMILDEIERKESLPKDKESKSEEKIAGCFIKTAAFFIDNLIIVILSFIISYPFSNFINNLSIHSWIPGFLICALYFSILESSSGSNNNTLGKKLLYIKVVHINGKSISIFSSFLRYIIIAFPFLDTETSNSIAYVLGIKNANIEWAFYLIGMILFIGNTVFMFFHPQKRGFHDIFLKTVVIHKDYVLDEEIKNFPRKPLIAGFIVLSVFLLIYITAWLNRPTPNNNTDLTAIEEIHSKIIQASSEKDIDISYNISSINGKIKSHSLIVYAPVPFDKADNDKYIEDLSTRLFKLTKASNKIAQVDTISLVLYARKYYGIIPFRKKIQMHKSISEIN